MKPVILIHIPLVSGSNYDNAAVSKHVHDVLQQDLPSNKLQVRSPSPLLLTPPPPLPPLPPPPPPSLTEVKIS